MSSPAFNFLKLYPDIPSPRPADATQFGAIPLRAYQHCDPFTSASAYGWYIFPPITFGLLWDGAELYWSYPEFAEWHVLTTTQLPNHRDIFALHAPSDFQELVPPFLTAFPEPGVVQVCMGLIAQSQPGWSLLVRAPVNLPRSRSFEVLEGIVETDWWQGPLISNLRITQTDRPVIFDKSVPMLQIQPVGRECYSASTLAATRIVESLAEFGKSDWMSYRAAVFPSGTSKTRSGAYSAEARRRRKNSSDVSA